MQGGDLFGGQYRFALWPRLLFALLVLVAADALGKQCFLLDQPFQYYDNLYFQRAPGDTPPSFP